MKILVGLSSTFFTLIPLIFGIANYKTAGINFRRFFWFIVYWFLTDFFVGYLYHYNISITTSKFLFTIYPLVEAIFLFYFLSYYLPKIFNKKIKLLISIAFLITWSVCNLLTGSFNETFFNSMYEIVIAFLSGFVLLKIAERSERLSPVPELWFISGIFIYCFCTFFIFAIFTSIVRDSLWLLHNSVNIVSCIFFARGFYLAGKKSFSFQ